MRLRVSVRACVGVEVCVDLSAYMCKGSGYFYVCVFMCCICVCDLHKNIRMKESARGCHVCGGV